MRKQPSAWSLLVCVLLIWIGLLASGNVAADPVPEPKPIEGRGNRGQPELCYPAGVFVERPYLLLRSCVECHQKAKHSGVSVFWHDGTPMDRGPERLKYIESVIAEQIHTGITHGGWWIKDEGQRVKPDDLADLKRALPMIQRLGLKPFTKTVYP